jgi:hypothetical protein
MQHKRRAATHALQLFCRECIAQPRSQPPFHQIINVLVTDIEPAAKVKAAMNEVWHSCNIFVRVACLLQLPTAKPSTTTLRKIPCLQINAAQRLRLAAYEQSEADKASACCQGGMVQRAARSVQRAFAPWRRRAQQAVSWLLPGRLSCRGLLRCGTSPMHLYRGPMSSLRA